MPNSFTDIDDSDLEVIVNLSGGIDSTYLLWKYLKEGRNVLVHHCSIKNFEGRIVPESIAVNKILKWLIRNNLNNFKFLNSYFDYGNLNFIVRDIEVIGFLTGVILRNPLHKNIKEIAISANANDESNNPNEQSVVRRKELLSSIMPRKEFEGYELDCQISFPIINMTKKEIMKDMPKDLLELCWFCRKPIADGDTFLPCKKCKTCKEVLF